MDYFQRRMNPHSAHLSSGGQVYLGPDVCLMKDLFDSQTQHVTTRLV